MDMMEKALPLPHVRPPPPPPISSSQAQEANTTTAPPPRPSSSSSPARSHSSNFLAELCEAPTTDPDEESSVRLAALGYRQELYRGFSALMSFSIDFSCFSAITSISVLYRFSLVHGGTAVMMGGWCLTWAMTLLCALVMGEICSTYPMAGSVYAWAGELCPVEWAPFFSYWVGIFHFLGYVASTAACAYIFADTLSATEGSRGAGIGATSYLGREFTEAEMVAVAVAVLLIWGLLNLLRVDQLGYVQNFGAMWQVLTTLAIVATLLAYPPAEERASDAAVWRTVQNESGFLSIPYVCLLGLLPSLYGFTAWEASAHMCEETQQASRNAPRAMVVTVGASGLIGLIYMLGLAYATKDMDAVMGGVRNAAIATYVTSCGPTVGRILSHLLVSNVFFAGLAELTVASRTAFAMARDQAFPYSKYLRQVDSRLKEPIRVLGLCIVLDVLLLLLPLATPVAFYAITSVACVGFQLSYALPILQRATVAKRFFTKAEFHLGNASVPLAWISAVWLSGTSLLFFLPLAWPLNPLDFNWTCVLVGGVVVLGSLYWWMHARISFPGPNRLPYEAEDEEEVELDGEGKDERDYEEDEEVFCMPQRAGRWHSGMKDKEGGEGGEEEETSGGHGPKWDLVCEE